MATETIVKQDWSETEVAAPEVSAQPLLETRQTEDGAYAAGDYLAAVRGAAEIAAGVTPDTSEHFDFVPATGGGRHRKDIRKSQVIVDNLKLRLEYSKWPAARVVRNTGEWLQDRVPYGVRLAGAMAEAGLQEPDRREKISDRLKNRVKRWGGRLATARQVAVGSAITGLQSMGEAALPSYEYEEKDHPKSEGIKGRLTKLTAYGGKQLTRGVEGVNWAIQEVGYTTWAMNNHVSTRTSSIETPIETAETSPRLRERLTAIRQGAENKAYAGYLKFMEKPVRNAALGAVAVVGAAYLMRNGVHFGGNSTAHDLKEHILTEGTVRPKAQTTPSQEHITAMQGRGIAPKHVAPLVPVPAHLPSSTHTESFTLHHGQTIWGHEEHLHPSWSQARIRDHVVHLLRLNHWSWADATRLADNTEVKTTGRG